MEKRKKKILLPLKNEFISNREYNKWWYCSCNFNEQHQEMRTTPEENPHSQQQIKTKQMPENNDQITREPLSNAGTGTC